MRRLLLFFLTIVLGFIIILSVTWLISPVLIPTNSNAVVIVHSTTTTTPLSVPTTKPLNLQPLKIVVDGVDSDWKEIKSIAKGSRSVKSISAIIDNTRLYVLVKGIKMVAYSDIYIDTDSSESTGYKNSSLWSGCGADYLVEDEYIYRYTGNGEDWEWERIGQAIIFKNYATVEMSVKLSQIGIKNLHGFKIGYIKKYEYDPAPVRGNGIPNVLLNSVSGDGSLTRFYPLIRKGSIRVKEPSPDTKNRPLEVTYEQT